MIDMRGLVRKGVTYFLVMLCVGGIFALTAVVSAHATPASWDWQVFLSSIIAAGIIASCFQPLQSRIQRVVDGEFFQKHVAREQKLYDLSREVITHTTTESMASALMRVLGETLHPKSGALYLRARDGNGFQQMSLMGPVPLPSRLPEDCAIARYCQAHPLPFVHVAWSEEGTPLDTRRLDHKERTS